MASQATRPEEFEISTTRVADGSRGETVCTWRQWGTLAASLHLGLPDQHMCAPPRRTSSVGGGLPHATEGEHCQISSFLWNSWLELDGGMGDSLGLPPHGVNLI